MAAAWLSQLVAVLSRRRPKFDTGAVRVWFVVDTVALEQFSLLVFQFFPVSNAPPMCSTLVFRSLYRHCQKEDLSKPGKRHTRRGNAKC